MLVCEESNGLPNTIPNKYDGLPTGYQCKSRATNDRSPSLYFSKSRIVKQKNIVKQKKIYLKIF